MPIYEYYCKDCLTEHEIRSSKYKKESEMTYKCIKCGSNNTKRFPTFPAYWVFCEKGAYRQDEKSWNSDSPDWNYSKYLLRLKRGIIQEIKELEGKEYYPNEEQIELRKKLQQDLMDVDEKLSD